MENDDVIHEKRNCNEDPRNERGRVMLNLMMNLMDQGFDIHFHRQADIPDTYKLVMSKKIPNSSRIITRTEDFRGTYVSDDGIELEHILECLRKEIELMEKNLVGRKQRKTGLEIVETFVDEEEQQ